MNARFLVNKGRLLSGTAILAVIVMLLAAFVTPSAYAGGSTCTDTMSSDAVMYEILFSGGVAETLPGPAVEAGQVICVEASGVFDVAFKSNKEFFLNGGHVTMTTNASGYFDGGNVDALQTFMVTGADVETAFSWSPTDADIITAYVGQLQPVARPTPSPAVVTPPPPAAWNSVTLPTTLPMSTEYELKVTGVMTGSIQATGQVTVTTTRGDLWTSIPISGSSNWLIPQMGLKSGAYSVTLAPGAYWHRFDITGDAGAVLRIKGTATSAGSMTKVWKKADGTYYTDAACKGAAVVFDPARHTLTGSCGGAPGTIWSPPAPIGPALPRGWAMN